MKGESYLTEDRLLDMGFKEVGKNVKLSGKANIYNPERISSGSNVRIDDFRIRIGDVKFGSYDYIASYAGLFGRHLVWYGFATELEERGIIESFLLDSRRDGRSGADETGQSDCLALMGREGRCGCSRAGGEPSE